MWNELEVCRAWYPHLLLTLWGPPSQKEDNINPILAMFITPVTLTDITIKVGFCIHLSKILSCAPCCKGLNLQILRSMTFWLLQRDFMSSAFHGRWLFGHISPWGKQITACWKLLRANYYHQHRSQLLHLGQLQPSEVLRLEHAARKMMILNNMTILHQNPAIFS